MTVLVETIVREDAIALYGFLETAERDWFRILTTVQGVGARVALSILSTLSPDEIARAIAAQDRATLSRPAGVGPKLAARLATELKDKAAAFGVAPRRDGRRRAGVRAAGSINEDAVSALVNLGYKRGRGVRRRGARHAAAGRRGQARCRDPRRPAGAGAMSGGPDRVVARPSAPRRTRRKLALRPQTLDDFIGQKQVRENLKIFIAAAKSRGEALDHVLFHGPPGLGKTTLAQIVAREMGVGFRATSGPVIQKAGDLAAQLTNLQPHDVLFIDEIHRLNPAIEEILYPAMEDFQLDLMIGEGPAARSVRIDLPPFTLVGATTRSGLMTRPLRERFGIPLRLVFYEPAELETIVHRAAARSEDADGEGRRRGDRQALARHAARGQPSAASRARLRVGGRPSGGRRSRSPTQR